MSEKYVIALATYGTHTKIRQGKRLSALKIGYTNAVAEVLLMLIPTSKNISSKRDSYVYIHLPNKPKLRHNWLFVEVTDEELATAEKITMANRSSRGITCWRDNGWILFPCLDNPEYHAASSPYDIPKGSPHGYWSINSAGETSATGGSDDPDALIAEYSKLDPDKSAWWWIPGNDATYTHRSTLKRAGCRWRRNRRAYSYVGDQLPESLLAILDNAEECRAIMAGMTPEEAKQTFRNGNSSSDTQLTPIEHLIDAILRDQIETINMDGQFPLLMTTDGIVVGQDVVGVDDPKRVWYLSGSLQAEQTKIVHTTAADWSHTTRRWLFNAEQEIVVLDAFLTTLDMETSMDEEDKEPCSIDEAAAVLGVSVQRDEPPVAYERGRTAWTTRNLPAGIEGRTNPIISGTKYTIFDIDFTGDPKNPVYVIELVSGEQIRVQEEELLPQRLFSIGQTVYARQDSETSDAKQIATGHAGTITKLYRFNPNLGALRGHTYDVDWQDIGVEWMFEDELTPEPTVSGIQIKRRSVTPSGGPGTSPSDARKARVEAGVKSEALETPPSEQYDCPCEVHAGPKGWLPADHLGTWIACAVCNPDGMHMPKADPTDPDAEAPPAVRIIQASKLTDDATSDDAVSNAIRHATKIPAASMALTTPAVQTRNVRRIPQACVGELTGSVIANVFCYGFATHAGTLIYLNMGGPRSGVEAIRAKLAKGQAINLVPDEGPSVELTPGEGITGIYTAYINNMSEARFVSMILAHEHWVDPNYGGQATTYIMHLDDRQAKGQLLHHVRELVSVPVFPQWIDYLWQAGQTAMLLRNCKADGGITLKVLDLDSSAWKRIITGGVANDIIRIPQPLSNSS